MYKKILENQNFTTEGIISLYNNGAIKHSNTVAPLKTSAKYLHLLNSEMPTPSLQFECYKGEWICVAGNNFLATLVAYVNGAKYKELKKYCELSTVEKRVFDNSFVNIWKINYV